MASFSVHFLLHRLFFEPFCHGALKLDHGCFVCNVLSLNSFYCILDSYRKCKHMFSHCFKSSDYHERQE